MDRVGKNARLTTAPALMNPTVEDWARSYIESRSLSEKISPPPPPSRWSDAPRLQEVVLGRPRELQVTRVQPTEVKLKGLRVAELRTELMHKFWHHELQAAELMAWALVRFVDAPLSFRQGLLGILLDEVRHMGLYQKYLEQRGLPLGTYPVRDWLWERITRCTSPASFVAALGMGFEAANLDHSSRFARRLREVGDEDAANIQEQIGREEISHVRFATTWFRTWTGGVDFDKWESLLPGGLTPRQVRGKRICLEERRQANMPDGFLDRLGSWQK